MLSHVTEETRQRPNPQGGMAGDGDMVLALLEGGKSDVTTGLTGDPVAEIGEGPREIVPRDVPRKPQALITSSRTK